MKGTKDLFGEEIYGVSTKASLWLLLPKVAVGILVSTAIIFALFWLQFGEVNSFPLLLAGVAAVFQILLVVGIRHQGRFPSTPIGRPSGFLDMIGALWLIAVIFGSVLAWFTADLANNIPTYAIPLHIATVAFAIVLPVLTSIPNYRYVTVTNAYITVPMLSIVSILPSLVGWRSAAAIWNSITR